LKLPRVQTKRPIPGHEGVGCYIPWSRPCSQRSGCIL
jgi:hypothetical protein